MKNKLISELQDFKDMIESDKNNIRNVNDFVSNILYDLNEMIIKYSDNLGGTTHDKIH